MAIRLDEARLRLLKMYGELSPSVNNTYNIGTSSLKFANMYATTFHGALDGNANTATALTSSAGSSAQPIYFLNGKPVAIINAIANDISGNAATATNADKVDGYHVSSLWRSDGATWNPQANITLSATANDQEWSFDISRNGYTGCYWHVWDSSRSTMLKITPDDGKVSAPYGFVGNLNGNASTATKLATARTISLISYKFTAFFTRSIIIFTATS